MTEQLKAVIDRLENMPKQGASYDEKGRHGWRNPIRADTGPMLQALVVANNPRSILEIGTAHGLSACYLGSHANGARITTIEWDEQTAKEAQANLDEAGLSAKVHCGDAMQVIDQLEGQFDFVFLDANKDGYLEQVLKLRERGLLDNPCLIVADNVIDREKECQNFLDWIQPCKPVRLETECGLLVARI